MTLNEIEQRLDALQAEKDKLTAELERLKSEKSEVKPWRAELSTHYSRIEPEGFARIHIEHGNSCDNAAYSFGNYYRTYALAEQDAKELALRGRVRQLRDALCEGHQFVHDKLNYFVFYCHDGGEFQVYCCAVCQSIAEIYFDTEEHAQTACDILNAEMGKESGGKL